MADAAEGPEPLKYQTLALKVSIHCEGCKKKVKKVLRSIEGVYKTDIDIQHQKVVVIGNVSVDTLVKKLVKTGKHAEPWPEPAPPPAAANSPGGATGGGSGGKKKKKNRNKNHANNKPAEAAPPATATAEAGGGGPIPPEKHDHASTCDEASDDEPDKPEGGGGSPKKQGAGDAQDGAAGAMAPFAMTPHGKQPIAPTANGNGGGRGKKKGKKGGSGNGNANASGDGTGAIAATVEVNPPDSLMKPASGNAGPPAEVDAGVYPPATAMSYPGYYVAGGHMPPYVTSYSTAHPPRSSAYYHPMVGAAYTGGGGGGGGGEYFYSTAPAPAAPGSYYMFSEENANACSVM